MKTGPNQMVQGNTMITLGNEVYEYRNFSLTKREYFAALALQGFTRNNCDYPEDDAKKAVEYADALIKALNEDK